MLTSVLWQPRGWVIYWHQRMPMEKKKLSQVSILFLSPQQIDEVLEGTDRVVGLEKEASEAIYRASIFSTFNISYFSQIRYLSLSWLFCIFCRNEVATKKMNENVWIVVIHMYDMQCFQQTHNLILNAYIFLVLLSDWIFLVKEMRNQLLWDKLYCKMH